MLRRLALAAGLLAALLLAPTAGAARPAHHRHAPYSPGARGPSALRRDCLGAFPARRDPANPLMLPAAPGPDPLHRARFFVDGPHHGAAAGAIVRMLGMNPANFPYSYSWARLHSELEHGALHRRLARNPRLARDVALMSKVAAQPEEGRWSLYTAGGGPGRIYNQVRGFYCHDMAADPGTVPIFTTFFLYQRGIASRRARSWPTGPGSSARSTRWSRPSAAVPPWS